MKGDGKVIAKKAPDFSLPDHNGGTFVFSEAYAKSPVLLVFYPGDFTPVCTKQLCNYRENFDKFKEFGLQIYGISSNPATSHQRFAKQYGFPFLLLSDQTKAVAKAFEATSFLMFGGVSRAVFIVNKQGLILYRYVEPTTLTHRSADELVGVLTDLKASNLI